MPFLCRWGGVWCVFWWGFACVCGVVGGLWFVFFVVLGVVGFLGGGVGCFGGCDGAPRYCLSVISGGGGGGRKGPLYGWVVQVLPCWFMVVLVCCLFGFLGIV